MSAHQATRPFVARTVRLLAIPIIIFWAAFAITTNTFVPKVEDVAAELAGPLVPTYAPSQYALLHIGDKFKESNSTSLTMVVLEADRPLEDQDHQYYDELVRRLKQDTRCNRRGLSSDSEANVCILDGPYKWDSIAKALRKRLWAEHLGVEATDVDDPVKSAKLWQDKRNTSRVREYDPAKAKDPPGPDEGMEATGYGFYDPDLDALPACSSNCCHKPLHFA